MNFVDMRMCSHNHLNLLNVISQEDWIDLCEEQDNHVDLSTHTNNRSFESHSCQSSAMRRLEMIKSVKNKLKKHTRFIRRIGQTSHANQSIDVQPEKEDTKIVFVQPARSTNPFEWDDDEDLDDDDNQSERLHEHQLAAKQRLLQILEPYCYSTDPKAVCNRTKPTNDDNLVSILTHSNEVNNLQNQHVVCTHLRLETQPTALVTRRFWSHSNLNEIDRTEGCTNSLGIKSTRWQLTSGIQSLMARNREKKRYASEANLCTVSTKTYCPKGMVYNRRLKPAFTQELPERNQVENNFRRLRVWTKQRLRRNSHITAENE